MTNEEYDKMFQSSKKTLTETQAQQTTKDVQMTEEVALKKLNLRTLKGAFMVLLMGYGLSLVAFLFERLRVDFESCGRGLKWIYFGLLRAVKWSVNNLWDKIFRKIITLIMFKYKWN